VLEQTELQRAAHGLALTTSPPAPAIEAPEVPSPSALQPTPLADQAARPAFRPVKKRYRLLKAYWVTFLVIASYISLKLYSRFLSNASLERKLAHRHRKNARRIERTILELQGLFIKVGQLISILTNFLPEAFRNELEGLQDQAPPRPYADIEQRVREEFGGKTPKELFARFDENPVASASIGQVHLAELHSGEQVAVKVQYPDIEEIVRLDLHALERIFRVAQRFVPYRGLDHVYREVREMVMQELDYKMEGKNIERIAANFRAAGAGAVNFPEVYWDYSTTRVLVTRFEAGAKISDKRRLSEMKIDRRDLARLVVDSYCKQIFRDGVYHADPHPGNILVRNAPDGPPGAASIIFLDFGATAEVSGEMRAGMIEFLHGVLHRDTRRLIAAMRRMGFISKKADEQVFERVVEYFHQRFQEEIRIESLSLSDIKFDPQKGLENLADLRRMNLSLRDISDAFHVPRQWIILERTVLLIMGLCTELDPTMNPMEVIRPYVEEFILGKDRDWQTLLVQTTKEIGMDALALPGEMKKLIARSMRGELEVRFRGLDDSARLVYAAAHQIIYSIGFFISLIFAYLFDEKGRTTFVHYALGAAGFFVLLLLGSFLGARSRRSRR
jgi:ubiquinone biosynthesis protein